MIFLVFLGGYGVRVWEVGGGPFFGSVDEQTEEGAYFELFSPERSPFVWGLSDP